MPPSLLLPEYRSLPFVLNHINPPFRRHKVPEESRAKCQI
ncbi:hypothetical protein BACPEC_00152 [[Bacteroides] pectinophilus ATCC 43243]|uniref:Uncharacterized protein n=1 Tax=[Bacteroides] pectinophilus ATCC 43243 TaxID=483218 RepID=B7AN98_9FIRM|nr:hypothetical protein BACPEC_00152 [[Bacteroides] pectinophilus ATCC 43243]